MRFDQQFLRDIVLFLAFVMLNDHGISGHVFLISGHVFLISGHVGPPVPGALNAVGFFAHVCPLNFRCSSIAGVGLTSACCR